MMRNVLGVPGGAGVRHLNRWIDNYQHRVGGGTVHADNLRFGGENGGLLPFWNRAPYICQEVMSTLETEMCGRVNTSGAALPPRMRGANGGASIVVTNSDISGSYGHATNAGIAYFEEIPAQFVVKDSTLNAEAGNASYNLVQVSPAIDLDGPYVRAAGHNGVPRSKPAFLIEATNWDLVPPQGDLPEQLRPYQAGRVEADAPPRTGMWKGGATVWNRAVTEGGTADGARPLGWVCVAPGTPGTWRNITAPMAF